MVEPLVSGWSWRPAAEIFVTILTGCGLGQLRPFWSRAECDGAGDRHHDRDQPLGDKVLFAPGTLSASPSPAALPPHDRSCNRAFAGR